VTSDKIIIDNVNRKLATSMIFKNMQQRFTLSGIKGKDLTICAAAGFTLIELIVTLAVVAILSAAMYQYFGTSMTHSAVPVFRLQKSFALQRVMENITADYLENYSSSLPGLQARIGAEGSNQSNSYGQYGVVENRFIKFTGQNETALAEGDPPNILKVTIKNEQDESLTVIFVQ